MQASLSAIPEQPQKTVSSTTLPETIGVKITSPIRGQQVPVGNDLTVLGISKYNATSNCQVSVILDGIKPYQNTMPLGLVGADYSQWKYTLSPTYQATLKEGTNKITAKLLCQGNPLSMTKFYSINVTGVNQTLPNLVSSNNVTAAPSLLPVSSNGTLVNPSLDQGTSTGNPSSSINSGSTDHSSSSGSSGSNVTHHHHNSKNNSHSNKEHSTDSATDIVNTKSAGGNHHPHEQEGGGQGSSFDNVVNNLIGNLG